MIVTAQILTAFLFVFATLIGPIRFFLPYFSDFRQLLLVFMFLFLFLSLLQPAGRQKIGVLFSSGVGVLFGLFYFFLSLSAFFSPSSEMKQFFVLLVAPGGFLVGFILSGVYPTKKLLSHLLFFVSSIGLLLSIHSIFVFLFGPVYIRASSAVVLPKIVEYQLYDLGRGRIYPITPLEFFIPFMFFLALFTRKTPLYLKSALVVLPLLALVLSNYRLKTTWGVIAAVIIWKKSKYPLRYLVLLAGGALLLASLFLSTNYVKRVSLVRQEDISTITSRLTSIAKSASLIKEFPVFGIGVGNYIHYASWRWVDRTSTSVVSFENPHNFYLLLATEAGLPVAIVFLILLFTLMKDDWMRFGRSGAIMFLPLFFSSWIFVLNSTFDWYPANLLAFFFFLRGIIYGLPARVRLAKKQI